MSDLSTAAGQRAHYAGVSARLGMSSRPAHVAKAHRARDFIFVQLDPIDESAFSLRSRWKSILIEVSKKHNLGPLEVRGHTRRYVVVAARNETFFRMRNETTMSLPEIGRRMGGFDHTTVLHGIRRHEAAMRGEVYIPKKYLKSREGAGL